MTRKLDLIIVGGGALGVFSAYHAVKQGWKVALIEKNHYPFNATVRNFGQIVPSGLSSEWRSHGLKSLEIYNTLQSIRDFTVRQHGSIYVASHDDEITLLHERKSIADLEGYHGHLMDAQMMSGKWPGLKTAYAREGLFFPEELSVDPSRMISLVIRYLVEQYELVYHPYTMALHAEVQGTGTCLVRTNTGITLLSDQVLICNGSEYQLLFPEAFRDDDIETVKIHMLMTVPQPTQRLYGNILTGLSIRRYEAFQDCPSWKRIREKQDQDPRVAEWGIHLLFKQADNGQIIIGDAHHYADAHHKESLGFRLEQEVLDYIMGLAGEIMELEDARIATTWYGIYSHAKHQDIIHRTIDNRIHILNAIGGKGMTASPGYTYHFFQNHIRHD